MTDQATQLRVYASIDEIGREEWSAVIDAADAPAFYHYPFLRAYERVPLQETEAFFYLAFGRPATAVLPACIQGTDDAIGMISGLGLPGRSPGDRILLTHVAHCYDTVLPARPHLLTPQLAERACAALADLARQAGVKWFAFLNVDDSGSLAGALTAAGLAKIPMNTRFRRDLAGYPTAEAFAADLPSKKARRALRSSRHQAYREGMQITAADPAGGAADAVELCRRTTARHGTADYYPERFHEFVTLARDLVTVTEVRLRDRLASAAISLVDRTRFHLWAGGIDYEITTEIHSAFPLMLWPAVAET
ncbi:MAG TPA: GNAT family N-acetyltransferase, partial [Streptosporangiaceae bacterium]